MNRLSKLEWCCIQKEGIQLIEPNERLAKDYINNADSDILDMKKVSKKWKNIVAYYACYNAFYSILQKTGIKCEIHSCTIELTKLFALSKNQQEFFKDLKSCRINVQYYLRT
ncbi:MAG: hypothetical protein KAT28_05655 [Candidatus Aenigmarchaeota archaeon]|nr:hypothetical protein [Candidatus Aenigmarchaeota archaeon]